MKHIIIFKRGFISVFLTLGLFSLNSFASAFTASEQSFVTTESIETQAGPAHLEVQVYEIRNADDLEIAKKELLLKINENSKSDNFFQLEVTAPEHKRSQIDSQTEELAQQIEQKLEFNTKLENKAIKIENAQGTFFKRNYNLTLAFVRFIANSATVSTGLIIGKHVPLPHATMIGVLAGVLSGAVQLKSDAIFKWLANSVYLVNTAKKLGLIKNNDNPQAAQKILKEVEMYGRWSALEAAFLLVCRTAMSLMSIPVSENLFLTVGKSTLSQGIYEVGILKAATALEKINPSWNEKTGKIKNVALFAGSTISVLSAIGSMINMPYSNLGFAVLTGSGIILNFSPKFSKIKSIERILEKWRPVSLHFRCEALFQ